LHNPRPGGCADRIRVISTVRGKRAAARASVAQEQCDRVIGMAGRDPHRGSYSAAVMFDFDDVFLAETEALCGSGTDERNIIPDNFGKRFRQFLQPTIVRESAVIDGGIRPKHNFDSCWRW